jgi:hypothetical protein
MKYDELLDAAEPIAVKLFQDDKALSVQELDTLMWMLLQDSRDAHEKGVFAFQFISRLEPIICDLEKQVQVESRRNQTFNARLLPLYDQYFSDWRDSRLQLFFDVCRTILEDSWISMFLVPLERPDDSELKQLEFSFFDDDF